MNSRLLILLTLLVSTLAICKPYVAIDSEKQKRGEYKYSLSLFDTDSSEVSKSIEIAIAHQTNVKTIVSPDNKYIAVLISAKKKKDLGTVFVYQTHDLSLVSTFKLSPLVANLIYKNNIPQANSLFVFSNDNSKLIAYVKRNKKNHIETYDLISGKAINSIDFGKKSFVVETTLDNTRLLAYHLKSSQREVHLFDLNTGAKLYTSSISSHVQEINLLGDYFYIKSKSKNNNQSIYNTSFGSLETGKILDFKITSKKEPIQTYNQHDDHVYLGWLDNDKDKRFSLAKISKDGQLLPIIQSGENLDPVYLNFNEENNKILVLGKNSIMTINLNDSTSLIGDLPFDATLGFFNKSSDKAYIREGSGSEVAIINLNTMKMIDRSGTGRAGVKFGQLLLSTAGVAMGAYTGYFSIVTYKSDTAMIIDESETNLFVINSRTNDVTMFNADDLSNRHEQSTGSGTFTVFQPKSSEGSNKQPVLTLSPVKLSFFDAETTELKLQIDLNRISAIDIDEKLLFDSGKDELRIISLVDGSVFKTYSNFTPYEIFTL
jgi:hypothetical protein